MATTTSIGSSTGATATTGNAFSRMGSDEFLKVVLSELRNQDPFQPQDSSKMLEQLSSIRNIESQLSLQQQLQSLVTQNGLAQAGELIGREVKGLDDSNNAITGVVTSVRVQDGKATLELDTGKQLPFERLTQIGDRVVAAPTTNAATAG